MRNPGVFMRLCIAGAQGVFFNMYFIMYLLAPKFSHRFVGYLEEEAVHTYSLCIKAIDDGKLPLWANMKAPTEAIEYYGLDPKTACMRDVILSVRADEAVHRSVNHHFSDIPQFYDIHNDKIHICETGFREMPIEEIKKLENNTENK